jgi:glucose/arabinose dehydrogenase
MSTLRTSWLALLAAAHAASGQDILPDPPLGEATVVLTEIASGLAGPVAGVTQVFPTDLAPFPDGSGRLGVMTLGGVVRLIDPVRGLLDAPYLVTANADTQVASGNFGMVALAFHPDFAEPGGPGFGRLYTIETEFEAAGTPDFAGSLLPTGFGGRHHDVLYEYTADDPAADVFTGSRREIFRVLQPGWDHNVMDLAFGTGEERGLLYITSGDGANASPGDSPVRDNAQFLGNVFGKVLRIDPLGANAVNGRYGVPADNPFVGVPDALPEIYTYGHRSPYRLTVDRATGDLWLGEVGQAQVEEINRLAPGANFGWPFKEGSFLFDEADHTNAQTDPDLDANGTGDFADANGLTDPVFELDHGSSVSITGGFVYRGARVPTLAGRYVFADAFRSGVWAGDPSLGPVAGQTGPVERLRIADSGAPEPFGVVSIGEDGAGELYLLTIDARVLRIDPAACGPADLAPPLGQLNFFDLSAYLAAFNAADPAADLAAPNGVFNFFDVAAYLGLYNLGCP